MSNNLKKQQENNAEELFEVLNNVFLFISKIDLDKNKIVVLQDKIEEQYPCPCEDLSWDEYLDYYIQYIMEQDRDMIRHNLSLENLNNLFNAKQKKFSIALPHIEKDNQIKWLGATLNFLLDKKDERIVYFIIHEPNENSLLKDIVNLYVYNNCDYFIYLDAKKNNYTMFCGSSNGTPLPPSICNDYSSEIVKYAEDFVVPEDREMVVREMTLSNVLKNLDEKGMHSFMCGIIDPEKGYTRKCLTYRYYNKENQTILLSRTDITDIYNQEVEYRKTLEEALERTQRDFMTGLFNGLGMQERVTFALSNISEQEFSALLFIDLDNFKEINDTFGHSRGDEVLCHVADVLKKETRMDDLVGRLGGDEFLVYLKDIKSVKNAERCADRLRRGVEKISDELEINIPTSCSIGIAFAPNDGLDYKILIKKADELVYRAKQLGKNRFSF